MPQIIIKDRQDREGPVHVTVGPIHRTLQRNIAQSVSTSELEVLLSSHEGNHIIVLPELNNGDAHSTQRPIPDPGGDEAGIGASRKLR